LDGVGLSCAVSVSYRCSKKNVGDVVGDTLVESCVTIVDDAQVCSILRTVGCSNLCCDVSLNRITRITETFIAGSKKREDFVGTSSRIATRISSTNVVIIAVGRVVGMDASVT
jgi:hypothetical protein